MAFRSHVGLGSIGLASRRQIVVALERGIVSLLASDKRDRPRFLATSMRMAALSESLFLERSKEEIMRCT